MGEIKGVRNVVAQVKKGGNRKEKVKGEGGKAKAEKPEMIYAGDLTIHLYKNKVVVEKYKGQFCGPGTTEKYEINKGSDFFKTTTDGDCDGGILQGGFYALSGGWNKGAIPAVVEAKDSRGKINELEKEAIDMVKRKINRKTPKAASAKLQKALSRLWYVADSYKKD
ncbi:MAG: hypothetical protein HQ564_03155 [Candidatus Saganbacteria bacterium]|nr:hypothetical protein [Candidatus Saganbacteria bacterium]